MPSKLQVPYEASVRVAPPSISHVPGPAMLAASCRQSDTSGDPSVVLSVNDESSQSLTVCRTTNDLAELVGVLRRSTLVEFCSGMAAMELTAAAAKNAAVMEARIFGLLTK